MAEHPATEPDHTAVRTALWRALHVAADAPPHVLVDDIGLRLADPSTDWRSRGDMNVEALAKVRAGIVARTRFVEDLLAERADRGVDQYVILGAGLDTFAQRQPELGARLTVFEVDQPGTQAWKQRRLAELGMPTPPWLRFVPVDFEAGSSWVQAASAAGFDPGRPSLIASTGVIMYLTREAIGAMLREIAALAPGTTLAMTFINHIELVEPSEQPGMRAAAEGARAQGTPFLSFFSPSEIVTVVQAAGFTTVDYVSAAGITARYFAGRADGLRPSNGEELVVATV